MFYFMENMHAYEAASPQSVFAALHIVEASEVTQGQVVSQRLHSNVT